MTRLPFFSKLYLNFLDKNRKIDYLVLALIGGLPILLAYQFGLNESQTDPATEIIYLGYMDKYNFWPLVFVLPGALFFLRWAFSLIAQLSPAQIPDPPPGIIQLLRNNAARESTYQAMRTWMSAPRFMITILLISIAIQVADTRELVAIYLHDADVSTGEYDWSNMFMIGVTSKMNNLIMVIFAYVVQFLITTVGIFAVVFLFSHNLFFLKRIFQRSRSRTGDGTTFITIDLEDVNKCFGFRPANDAFNTQIVALIMGGVVVLLSRFGSAFLTEGGLTLAVLMQSPSTWPALNFFPDIGQVLLGIGWTAALFIVSMPAVVKLLPRIGKTTDLTITNYLREFIPKSQWHWSENPTAAEIDYLAAQFANNSFWPTGNNRASQLFFYSAWIFLIILFPIHTSDPRVLFIAFGGLGIIAYLIKGALFTMLKSSLSFVDERLTNLRPDLFEDSARPLKKGNVSQKVFLSYRREDSAAYARLIHNSLLEYMNEAQIFMDIEDIDDGQDFFDEIDEAIEGCDVLIAIIGTQWSSCVDSENNRRIMQESDFVHLEIASALKKKRCVIPVLVCGSSLPEAADLPEDIKALARRQARELTDTRWDYDIEQLATALAELD